jgi:hypothetical protein
MRIRGFADERPCEFCGEAFSPKAAHATTCSSNCRVGLFRLRRKVKETCKGMLAAGKLSQAQFDRAYAGEDKPVKPKRKRGDLF